MKFYGLQKMTLLDFPGKVACTIFTGGCNFRCPFCHNAGLVTKIDKSLSYDERDIIEFLKERKGRLDGVCLTGGEPLLWRETAAFLQRVKQLGYLVKLDTNGSYPDRLKEVIDSEAVDYVAMDIKNSKEKYAATVGLEEFDLAPIERSMGILMDSGVDYEFRTTVVHPLHEVEDIEKIGRWIKGAKRYFLQNFKDSGNLISDGMSAKDCDTMQQMLAVARKYIPDAELRGI